MKVVRTKEELKALLPETGTVGLVMTMGALHDGHRRLVDAAVNECDTTVVSIYVNPLQFAPNEDFDKYPRQLEKDLKLLTDVDIVFAPVDEEMYPRHPLVRVDPGEVATRFEGKTRPTHFAGVLQVVLKVLLLVRPDVAYFGQKDAQQLALIKTMVADLDVPTEIRAIPIVRDSDGLALSSRNTYLSPEERTAALALVGALTAAKEAAGTGATPSEAERVLATALAEAEGVNVDYATIVNPDTFQPVSSNAKQGLAVVAARVGPTRLIDNMEVCFG
ncbi:pantoate--beta-alanine ligase [Flaviflexus massiliensis]|uniref:pantoate--beta-alanine ligase n=1 Tax=Flaviflexus massiliensis TaxID=1522309 RepID=UPI00097D8CEA|nr:pantoate--beta-alanine ligase [Flaviflexus massiliensis]